MASSGSQHDSSVPKLSTSQVKSRAQNDATDSLGTVNVVLRIMRRPDAGAEGLRAPATSISGRQAPGAAAQSQRTAPALPVPAQPERNVPVGGERKVKKQEAKPPGPSRASTRPQPTGPFTLSVLLQPALSGLDNAGRVPLKAVWPSTAKPEGPGIASTMDAPPRKLPTPSEEDGREQEYAHVEPARAWRHGTGLLFGRKVDTAQFGMTHGSALATNSVRQSAFSYAAVASGQKPLSPPAPASTSFCPNDCVVCPPVASSGTVQAGQGVSQPVSLAHGLEEGTGAQAADQPAGPASSPVPAKPLTGFRAMLALVRASAVQRDREATAELVRLLQPSDLAMLRLLAFKAERKLNAAQAAANAEMAAAGVQAESASQNKTPSGGKGRGTPMREERLLGLDGAVDDGFKAIAAADKEAAKLARQRNTPAYAPPRQAAYGGPLVALSAEEDVTGLGGRAGLKQFVARLQREKLVRAWVFTTLRARLKDVRAATAAVTSVHAQLVRRGAGQRQRQGSGLPGQGQHKAGSGSAAVGRGAGVGAGGRVENRTTATKFDRVAVAGAIPDGGKSCGDEARLGQARLGPDIPGQAQSGLGVGRPSGSGKTRLTRLKKAMLKERLSRWLDAHPDAKAVYAAARAVHVAGASAEQTVAVQARAQLKEAAEKAIRAREAKRLLKKAKKGKVAVPSVKAKNAVGRLVSMPGDPAVYARLLASRIPIGRKRLRAEMRKIVERGQLPDPLSAAADAAEVARASVMAAQQSQEPGRFVSDGGDVVGSEAMEPAAAFATARALASVEITHSTRKAEIVKAVPKLTPAQVQAAIEARHSAKEKERLKTNAKVQGKVEGDAEVADGREDEGGARVGGGGSNEDEEEEDDEGDEGRAAGRKSDAGGQSFPGPVQGPVPRAYVQQDPSPELDDLVTEMISTALFFQEKARRDDTTSGKKGGLKSKRRIVSGLREVAKGCRTGRVRLVVAAPNIDESSAEGSLDEAVSAVLHAAASADPTVPVIFALTRRKLGRALGSTLRASVVGFMSFENLRGVHTRALELADKLRVSFAYAHSTEGMRAAASAAHAAPANSPARPIAPIPTGRGGRWQETLRNASSAAEFFPQSVSALVTWSAGNMAQVATEGGVTPGPQSTDAPQNTRGS